MGYGLWWISWVQAWHSSRRHWNYLHRLVDILHYVQMYIFTFLENNLLRRRSIVHIGGGHQSLENMGLLDSWMDVWIWIEVAWDMTMYMKGEWT